MPDNIRVLCANVGQRWSYGNPDYPIAKRKPALVEHLTTMEGGKPPAIWVMQEAVKSFQVWAKTKFPHMVFFGNGVDARSVAKGSESDKDRAGDNILIGYDPHCYEELARVIVSAGVVGGIGKTYARAIQLRRKDSDASEPFWVITSHPPAGKQFKTLRVKHVRTLIGKLRAAGVDLARAIWGSDWNDFTPYPAAGVRTTLEREYGLRDVVRLVSAADFQGNSVNTAHGYGRSGRSGRHIDFVVIGAGIWARWGKIHRTDTAPYPADHNWVIAGVTV